MLGGGGMLALSSSEVGEVARLGEYCCPELLGDITSGLGASGGGGGGKVRLNFFMAGIIRSDSNY